MEQDKPSNVCKEAVYKTLFFDHAKQVRNYLYYKGAKAAEAEDLMQEAFLRLWRDCQKVPADKAKGFLFTVANNLFLDAKKHEKVALKFERRSNSQASPEDPQFKLETKELHQRLENAISQLPEKQRTVFLMNRMDKLTYAEIAERLGLSVKAVEKRMSKALVEMRLILKGI
ncbi:MAG TPA: RNA polymerase sigma factor [Bacteroidetes bacterium]|nr:RNA polymerase sigma factor [Bacteroidota bacterium]